MSPIERRLIEELVTMHKLEPNIRDVFVEGSLDRSLVDWFLSAGQVKNVSVREIDSIDVPTGLIEQAGFAKNNRGRVLTLARELESKLNSEALSIACVVDADFDPILNNTYTLKLLLSTDYSSMELYFFDVRPLEKFLKLGLLGFPKPANRVLADITIPLVELFAIRLANHILGWNISLVSFERCCELTANGVELDTAEYVDRCLNAANRYADRTEFNRTFNEWRGRLTGDPRTHIHGHDFLAMLAWYVRKHKAYNASEGVFERTILACAEFQVLRAESLFATLLNRLAAG